MAQATNEAIPTFVVGVGASAGGLEALEAFFQAVPLDTGMAFVVVQHLSPDFKSVMSDLLGRQTALPIALVEDGMRVEPNHIYLIPPKKEMIIAEGRLLLSERDRQHELSLPIDVFLRSLAQDCGPRAVAVILSGSGSDGSRGIRHVHDAGGLVVVQDASTAQFDGMPRSAIDSGIADHVLPPAAMIAVLERHASVERKLRQAEPHYERPTGIGAVYQMLLDEFALDFTHYKPSTVTRRIERRLALAESQDIEEYVQRLGRDRDELDILYRDLLIGVTRFFRDKEAYAVLEQQVLPDLVKRANRDVPLRIWIAGCATGEEAYSIAISISELMRKLGPRPVKIFATDIHAGSLERAARGLYEEDAIANVDRERLERYFTRVGNAYQVLPEIRQMIVFARHNVIRDAPFTRVDLVTCRNLLIYLQVPAQQKVLSLIHFALNRGGTMFLGPSESAGPFAHDFESIDKHWRIYRKQTDLRVPTDRMPAFRTPERPATPLALGGRQSFAQLLATYDLLLDDVMPPSLLLSERGEVIHAFGGASKFLKPRDGRQGLDVLPVVDEELKMVLVGGLKRALHEPSSLVFKGVRIDARTYDVTVRQVRNATRSTPHVLVSFQETDRPVLDERPKREIDLDQVSRSQLALVEAELDRTKENLQAAIEELETSNEELSAANEELQASNEELQSTNEELQSVNEELYTVNGEYQRKIAELTELTNDMDNLFASTEVGTIFLDADLRIRKFTPQIAETFALVAHDVGRPIVTFSHKLDYPDLEGDLKRVLASGVAVERELKPIAGTTFFARILPYRVKGEVGGVVITLIDVSGLKSAEDALFHERYLLNSLLANVQDAIYFKDAGGRFIRANAVMCERLGLSDPAAIEQKTVLDLPNRDLALALHQKDESVLRHGRAQHEELEQYAQEGELHWSRVTRLPLRGATGEVVGVGVISRDVSEQKRAEERIHQGVRRRDEFLAMLSHELRNPLGAIVAATKLLSTGPSGRIREGQLVEILDRQSKQMARLLDDLLEVSRVTQNKIELRRSVIDLRTVIRDAISAAQGLFDTRGITLTSDVEDVPMPIDADPARLQQVHVNLLSNAAKYTQRGGHVNISARVDGAQICVRVRDDGLGIADGMLESIFDLFVQSRATLDRSAGGLGVGLTLVRSLVSMHGGTVSAHSEGEGRGSEFVVRLPLAVAQDDVRARFRALLPPGAKVLVVEDNKDSREMFCEMLERAGFSCRAAEDGPGALSAIEEFRPHVAIMDIGLPNIDGFEVARRVRSDPRNADIRLIALTGYGRAADRAAAAEAGFDDHLVKPVDTDRLLALLTPH
ncbi:MAG TPA: chemotaxis protein CheB [Polyangiaceae bacterium]|jgi:two-component system CheB/CheR fusion protein